MAAAVALKVVPAAVAEPQVVELQAAARPVVEQQAEALQVVRALLAAECKAAAQAAVAVVLPAAVARAGSHLPAEQAVKAAVVRRPVAARVVAAAVR